MALLVLAMPLRAQATAKGIPDFRGMLTNIIDNQKEYNRYNDSIFLIHKRSEWMDFFFRRSTKNHEIFHENKLLLDSIYTYFEKDTANIPSAAYDSLYTASTDYLGTIYADPFISKKLCAILLNYYKKHPVADATKCQRSLMWLSTAYYQIYLITKDYDTLAKSYSYIHESMKYASANSLENRGLKAYALELLLVPVWFTNKLQTLDESRDAHRQMREILADTAFLAKANLPPAAVARWKVKVAREDENIVRNFYLPDEKSMDKAFGDSVLHVLIKRMEQTPRLPYNSLLRLYVMKIRTGDLTAKEALKLAMEKYEKRRRILDRPIAFNETTLNSFLQQYYNIVYINDIADIPERQKHKNCLMYCRDIAKVYQRRKDEQNANNYIKNLVFFTTYKRLIEHLTEGERINFLQHMIVYTQVTTYAHSVHVAKLAEALTAGIVKHRPDLLVGYLGLESVKEVRRYRKKICKFLYLGSLFHDLGKNDMISVVSNDYRPLTREEIDIIKMHPRLGLKYLDIAPTRLAPFHDTTLGHHKWYNGKGGYPDDFDNTTSRRRLLIDIITLSDCMQAATEKLGRNYKKEKSFDTVFSELKEGAGTRYNPDLISLIEHNSDVAANLKAITIDGWLDIYYDIYKRFFR